METGTVGKRKESPYLPEPVRSPTIFHSKIQPDWSFHREIYY
jgi:hypothetical protein